MRLPAGAPDAAADAQRPALLMTTSERQREAEFRSIFSKQFYFLGKNV